MICKWTNGLQVFEFDAISRAEEIQKVRAFAKEHGFKFSEMKKEDRK